MTVQLNSIMNKIPLGTQFFIKSHQWRELSDYIVSNWRTFSHNRSIENGALWDSLPIESHWRRLLGYSFTLTVVCHLRARESTSVKRGEKGETMISGRSTMVRATLQTQFPSCRQRNKRKNQIFSARFIDDILLSWIVASIVVVPH